MRAIYIPCLLLFVPFSGYSQFKIKGKIEPSPNWERLLYVIRVDRLGLQSPVLIDSVKLDDAGTFEYTFIPDPQGIFYELRQPPKGGNYRSLTSGYNDNWFHVLPYIHESVTVSAHADSLYYSLNISGSKMNEDLMVFREFKRPVANLLRQLSDSIKAYPSKADYYKESGLIRVIAETENIKKKIVTVLDTCAVGPLVIAGLYYLTEAYFGQNPQKEIEKYSHKLLDEQVNIIRNIKRNTAEKNRLGTILTDVKLLDYSGKRVSINSLQGKFKVLDFWASWCGPCRQANKSSLPKLHKFLSENGIPLIAISIDEDKAKWKKAVETDKTTWHQWLDTTHVLKKLMNIQGVPIYFVIDDNNKVVYEAVTTFQIEAFIKSALNVSAN